MNQTKESTTSFKTNKTKVLLLSLPGKLFKGKGFNIGSYPHIFKKIGIWLAVGIIVVMIILKLTIGAQISDLKPYPKVLFMLAFWLIAMSKDKIEDEGVANCRMQAYKFTYSFILLLIIWNIISVQITHQAPVSIDLMIFTFQFVYLIAFKIGKYINNKI